MSARVMGMAWPALWLLALSAPAAASADTPHVFGVAVEFFLFAATLLGIAVLHRLSLQIALTGLAVIVLFKLVSTGFHEGAGFAGLMLHVAHHWVTLVNLLALITGFALLADHFYASHVPRILPRFLPEDWKGGFMLLLLVFVLSSFLDNIAAAMIGGTMAAAVFRRKLHVGYLAAIVAASNAGGAGSVVGDTTTTMMWIKGVNPLDVLHAYVAAGAAIVLFGVPAAIQQQRFSPIVKDAPAGERVDGARLFIVAVILAAAIAANVTANVAYPALADSFPWIGAAVWVALLATAALRRPDFTQLPGALRSSAFLLALVLCASLMPVDELPLPSWHSTLGLGTVSAVFDNIPLTALALEQGGYDWGMLAYAVGFGGSMLWFGSSAGVALCGLFPEGRSALAWLRGGWHVAVAYFLGFSIALATVGWHPVPLR